VGEKPAAPGGLLEVSVRYLLVLLRYFFSGGTFFGEIFFLFVTCDCFKVKGEDPATPAPLQRNDPGTVTIPQHRFNKTKQHTKLGEQRPMVPTEPKCERASK